MALSSLPVWSRVDPLSVLLLSERDRKKRERELREVDQLEEGLGELLDGPEPEPDDEEKDPETDDPEIDDSSL